MPEHNSKKLSTERMADGLLSIIIVANLALVLTSLIKHEGLPPYLAATVGLTVIPLLVAFLGIISFYFSTSVRLVGVNTFIAFVAALYGFEIYLRISEDDARQKLVGNLPPSPIKELREKKIEAYINWPLAEIDVELTAADGINNSIFPFTGPSHSTIVFCPQGRTKWITYQSDKHGFRNTENAWTPGKVDVATVGDSFTEGFCVPDNVAIAGRLRQNFSAVLNLGKIGMGPLKELAIIREYLTKVRPKSVVWIYFEDNDLVDLDDELQIPTLVRYLEPSYTQNSIQRQAELDAGLKSRINKIIQEAAAKQSKAQDISNEPAARTEEVGVIKQWQHIVKLARFRALFGLFLSEPPGNFQMFDRIIRQAKKEVEAWGGHLYFIHLPGPFRYTGFGKKSSLKDFVRDKVMEIVKQAGIPAIDISDNFGREASSLALFQTANSHYNAEGYRITSDAIINMLNAHRSSGQPYDQLKQ